VAVPARTEIIECLHQDEAFTSATSFRDWEIIKKLIPSGQGFGKLMSSLLKEPRQGSYIIGNAKQNSMITIG
jgi:hypothetical protein